MSMGLRRKPKTGVAAAAGSVWESRMKSDEYNGGIKVFNGKEQDEDDHENRNNDSAGNDDDNNKSRIDEVQVGTMINGKRKTWKSERSDMVKNVDDKSNESSVNTKIKKSPIRKTRSQTIMPPPTPATLESRKSKSESVLQDKHCEENDERRIEKGDVVGVTWETEEKDISRSNEVESPPKGVDDDEEIQNKSLTMKEISNVAEEKASKSNVLLVVKEKIYPTHHSINLRKPTVLIPPIVKKQSPSQSNQPRTQFTTLPSKSKPNTNDSQRIPTTHSKMQSIVDLVMWRDVSRTTFVFGIGTFFVISSSYTKDLNISLISVISYVGLLYLAAIFLFRSFISRGNEMNDSSMDYVFGEEEAIRLVKLILPYVNECLLNLKALFSGDPATTIKMAIMLYVLARCGSSITIWKMAKLSFFGVFTIPKICSSYSKHLTNYGAIWIGRIREGWESCSHKKAVGFAIFTIFWNLSSYLARIWAVFVLFVAFRIYHQQSMVEEEEEVRSEYPSQPGQRQHTRPIPVATGGKQKKIY